MRHCPHKNNFGTSHLPSSKCNSSKCSCMVEADNDHPEVVGFFFSLYSKRGGVENLREAIQPKPRQPFLTTSLWSLQDKCSTYCLVRRVTEGSWTRTVTTLGICQSCTTGFLAQPNTSGQTWCLLLLMHMLCIGIGLEVTKWTDFARSANYTATSLFESLLSASALRLSISTDKHCYGVEYRASAKRMKEDKANDVVRKVLCKPKYRKLINWKTFFNE